MVRDARRGKYNERGGAREHLFSPSECPCIGLLPTYGRINLTKDGYGRDWARVGQRQGLPNLIHITRQFSPLIVQTNS